MDCNLRLVGLRRLSQCYLRVKNDEMFDGCGSCVSANLSGPGKRLVVMNDVGRGH